MNSISKVEDYICIPEPELKKSKRDPITLAEGNRSIPWKLKNQATTTSTENNRQIP
jgi:hypothetical protein